MLLTYDYLNNIMVNKYPTATDINHRFNHIFTYTYSIFTLADEQQVAIQLFYRYKIVK